jgi:ATP-dependent Lon protease
LWDALLPFLETETAARYRDVSLDAELDLSAVSYVATANDVTVLAGHAA